MRLKLYGNRGGQMDNEWNGASFCGLSFACKIGVVGFMGLVFGKWNEIFSVGFLLVFFSPLFSKMIFFLSSNWVCYLFIYLLDLDIHFGTKDCRKRSSVWSHTFFSILFFPHLDFSTFDGIQFFQILSFYPYTTDKNKITINISFLFVSFRSIFSPTVFLEKNVIVLFWTFRYSSQLTVDLEIQKLNIWVNFVYMTPKIQQNMRSTRISDPTETVIPHPIVCPDSGKKKC